MYLVIDIGSNTIRVVVFRLKEGMLIPVLNKKYSAGLAGYITKSGAMGREGIERCVDILAEIREIIDAFSFDGIYPFATASLRNITNSQKVLEEIEARTGLSVRLLTGKEEAYYDYYGAVQDLGNDQGILIDIGGGSTEVVVYRNGKPLSAESLHIGSLNLFNRYVSGLLPDAKEIKNIQQEVKGQLGMLDLDGLLDKEERPLICGVGGTARAALNLYNAVFHLEKGNRIYERSFLKQVLTSEWEDSNLTRLILKTAPERIHTLLPGIAVLYTAAKFFHGKRIITSSHGVREGYLYEQLEKAGVLHE
ncbi:MAG: hypothetical protein ACLRWH_11060 [Emergencia sp.]